MRKFFHSIARILVIFSIFFVYSSSTIVKAETSTVNQSDKVCKGVIIDSKKVPIIGAAVIIKGTHTGATSDSDGNFKLIGAKKGDILEISCIGYATKIIKWDGNPLKIVLKDDSKLLNEAVVVGLGTQKRNTITASVSTVGHDAIKDRPVLDVTSVLQGNVAGLNISTSASESNVQGGELGGNIKFNIRGIGSINGGEPYVLVDGVEQNLSNINPADIESITVLKDASAAAIYGSRAAYGVVLVTTKSGKKDSFKITYNASFGAASPINIPKMMNSLEYANYKNAYAITTGNGKVPFSEESINRIKNFIKNPYSPENPGIYANEQDNYWRQGDQSGNTDWFKYHFKNNSFRQLHNLNISGGSEKIQYYIGLGFNDQNGLMRNVNDNLKKYTLNTNFNIKPSKWLKINLNNNISYIDINRPLPNMTIVYHNIARLAQNFVTHLPVDSKFNIPTWNQNLLLKQCDYNENRITDALQLSLTLTPLKDWNIVASVSGRFNFNLNDFKMGEPKWARPNGEIVIVSGTSQGYGPRGWNWRNTGWKSYSREINYDFYISPNFYTTYMKAWDKNFFKGMFGFQSELDNFSYLRGYRTQLLTNNIFSFRNANGPYDIGEDRTHWSTAGFYGKLNYNWDNIYFVEISGRIDGSSRFSTGNRWGIFPSGSVGIDFARMDWFKQLTDNISQLKLRSSYGRLGNQNGVGLYQYYNLIGLVQNDSGAWLLPGINSTPERGVVANTPSISSIGLTWEKVDTGNIGLDLTALDDRLTTTLELYQRNTRDMVGPAESIPGISGIPESERPKENNSDLRTRGWELSITWKDSFKSGFNYSLGVNLSNHQTIITKYNNPTGLLRNNHTGLKRNQGFYKGMDIGEIWGYKADNLFMTNNEIDAYVDKVDLSFFKPDSQWQKGDLKYIDVNGDGKVNPGAGTVSDHGDLIIIGNTTPRYNFGINMSLGYKGIQVSALWQGVGKRDFPISASTYMFGGNQNYFKEHLNYFSDSNPNGFLPRLSNGKDYDVNVGYNTTRYLLNAAYIRLKNLTISYSFSPKFLKAIHLSSLRIYCSGENLLTFTKLPKAFDPETINQVNTWAGGSNAFAPGLTSPMNGNGNGKVYPLNRNYVLGIDISF